MFLYLSFCEISKLFSRVGGTILHSHQQSQGFWVFHILTNTCHSHLLITATLVDVEGVTMWFHFQMKPKSYFLHSKTSLYIDPLWAQQETQALDEDRLWLRISSCWASVSPITGPSWSGLVFRMWHVVLAVRRRGLRHVAPRVASCRSSPGYWRKKMSHFDEPAST